MDGLYGKLDRRIQYLCSRFTWGARKIGDIVSGGIIMDKEAADFGVLIRRHYAPLMEPIPLFSHDILPEAKIRILPDVGHVILDRGEEIKIFINSTEE